MSGVAHLGFIVGAYAVTAIALAVTVAALVLDNRTQKQLLARLDPRGRDEP